MCPTIPRRTAAWHGWLRKPVTLDRRRGVRGPVGNIPALVFLAISVAGCGILPFYARANKGPTADWTPTRATAELTLNDLSHRVFVGVAMSGGGSRAANFSAAVLLELQKIGLLQHVSAISSVSGSSLTAAYYGLFGEETKTKWNRDRLRELMLTNFEAKWFARWFLPHNIIRYWLTEFDRSDIMKGVFDDVLFEGKTFGNMPLGRPRVLINATSFTTGQRFVFTDETFRRFKSRLDAYPVSHAVMASGAFPGIFHNVTLQNYRISGVQHYEHLYDGGPSDNLGINTLIDIVQKLYNPSNPSKPNGCFLFIVDAHPFQELPAHVLEADTRKALDFLIDSNLVNASDVLLTTRREDVLRQVGIDTRTIDPPPYQEFPIFPDRPKEKGGETCWAWHLTFQRLLSPGFATQWASKEEARDGYRHARQVGLVVNAIPTRYQLAGPKPYTAQALQDYIFEAARLLLWEDEGYLKQTCDWFTKEARVPGLSCDRRVGTGG